MKLRIKYIEQIGWFAQVKKNFFSRWKTIGKHPNGFGLYDENNCDYPLESHKVAKSRCERFKNWYTKINQKPSYVRL